MNKSRKTAFTFILAGVIVPLLLIPFLTGYKADAGWFSNLMNIKVAFGSALAIPYRFVLAFAVLAIFVGVRLLDFSRQ
jgi:O-antigen ligase